jgi:hypothetical protein
MGWKEAQHSFEADKQPLKTPNQKASEPYSGAREATRGVVIERTFLRENDDEQETTCFRKDVWCHQQ